MNKFAEWLEAVDYNSRGDVVIKKGEVLYHGTAESFDTRKVKTSGYDEVFWTADDIMIARSYIPANGSYMMTSLDGILKDEKLRKELGVTDKIIKYAWQKHQEGYEKLKYWDDKHKEFSTKWKEIEKNKDYQDTPELDEFFNKWMEAEKNAKKYQQEWKFSEHYLRKFVAAKLKSLGYEVTEWGQVPRLMQDDSGKVLPASHMTVGKVLKVICGRDFKVYNYAYGKDGDLMDLDYHKLSLFRELEEKGYDGIIINDFAQTKKHGNYGHKAVGFFKKALPDLQIKQIRSQTHPKNDEW